MARLHESPTGHVAPLRVDRKAGIIYGVHVLGRESANNRRYTDNAMADGRRLCEGVAVNLDHADASGRTIRDAFGALRNLATNNEGKNVGDLHYLRSHPYAAMIEEAAERFPGTFGLSHAAEGESHVDESGVEIVEKITRVESVDIVRNPATNRGLFESTQGNPMTTTTTTPPAKTTVRELMAKHASDARASRASKLREMEDYGGVEVAAPPADAEGAVKAARRQMLVAVIDDDALDTAAKMTKIKTILGAFDKMSEKPAESKPVEGAANESIAQLRAELAESKRQAAIRDALETAGLTRSQLSEDQRGLIDAVPADKLPALLKTFAESTGSSGGKGGAKPPIDGKNGGDSESYDKLYESVRKRKAAS